MVRGLGNAYCNPNKKMYSFIMKKIAHATGYTVCNKIEAIYYETDSDLLSNWQK